MGKKKNRYQVCAIDGKVEFVVSEHSSLEAAFRNAENAKDAYWTAWVRDAETGQELYNDYDEFEEYVTEDDEYLEEDEYILD